MATFNKLPSGYWRAQIRRKGKYASKTFRLKSQAESWAIEAERAVELGKSATGPWIDPQTTVAWLIDLHIADMLEVGKPLLRSKAKCLEKLKSTIGKMPLSALDRKSLITFGKKRAKEGAGPVTIGMDLGYLRTVLVHAAAVHGIEAPTEEVTLARVALRRLGVVGKAWNATGDQPRTSWIEYSPTMTTTRVRLFRCRGL